MSPIREGKKKEDNIILANVPELNRQGLLAFTHAWLRGRRGLLLSLQAWGITKKQPCRPSHHAPEFKLIQTAAPQDLTLWLRSWKILPICSFVGVLVPEATVQAGPCQPGQLCVAPKVLTGGVFCTTATNLLAHPKQLGLFTQFRGVCYMGWSSPGCLSKERGWACVTHLSLEALEPHDVLAAGGVLLPKVLPKGVDLQGELPLHLGCLQGETSWHYPGGCPMAVSSSCTGESLQTCPHMTSAQPLVLADTLMPVEFGPGKSSSWRGWGEQPQGQTGKHPLQMTVSVASLGLALFPILKEGCPSYAGWFEDSGKAIPYLQDPGCRQAV